MKITIDNVTIEGTKEECENFFLKHLNPNKAIKNNDEMNVEDPVKKNPQSFIVKDIKHDAQSEERNAPRVVSGKSYDSISAAVIAQDGCSCALSGGWYHRSDCEAGLG